MAKRQATSELNHDNWDKEDEDEKEDAGAFKPVSDSELQNRVVKRARRTLLLKKSDAQSGSSQSPFSAFTGFSKQSAQHSFGFPSQVLKLDKSVIEKEQEAQNGGNLSFGNKHSSDVPKDAVPSKKLCPSEEAKPDTKNFEYFRQLQTLNESVLKWMQLHLVKNPCCDFTPVFNDYRNHLQKLDRLYPAQKKTTSYSESKSTTFKIPQPVARFFSLKKKCDDSESAKTSLIDPEMLYGANFASNTTNTSTNSFGIKTSTATSTGSKSGGLTTSFSSAKNEEEEEEEEVKEESEKKDTPGFSFGLKGAPDKNQENPTTKPFSFGFSNVSSSTEVASSGEEAYVPPKNEFTAVSEEDALYSKRCKLFFKKDDTYIDKGVGTLYIKPLDGKTQLLIRADTNLGNILLNIMLIASLPIERTGKNNVLIVCVPNPPVDAKNSDSKKAIPLLIRVKTPEDADELFEKLNEHKT